MKLPGTPNEAIALFDMDGTLADYDRAIYESLKAIHSEYEPPLEKMDLHDLAPIYEARRRLIVQMPGWWEGLRTMGLGLSVLAMCNELGFDNYILTKGPTHCPNAWKEKVQWCQRHLVGCHRISGINIVSDSHDVPAHNRQLKGLVYGRVLVDDFPEYIESWLRYRPRGLVIMPANQWNESFVHPSVIHYDGKNRDVVWETLKFVQQRASGEHWAV